MTTALRLSSATLINYRSWAAQCYDFPHSGVVMVKGREVRTKTSSGVGKTSLLSSPAYALGFGPPTTTTKAWGEDECSVVLDFLFGEEALQVRRGTDGLSFSQEGVKGRVAEERLKRITGSPELLKVVTWRPQRAYGHFFTKTPAERRDFLSKLLDLAAFDREAEESRRRAGVAKGLAEAAKNELVREKTKLVELSVVPQAPDLSGELAEAQADEREATRLLTLVEEADRARQRELQDVLAELRVLERSQAAIQDQLRTLATQRHRYAGICPTCGSATSTNEHILAICDDRSAALTLDLTEKQGQLTDLEVRSQALRSSAPPYQALRAAQSEARSRIESVRASQLRMSSEAARRTASLESSQQRIQQAQADLAKHTATLSLETDCSTALRTWQAQFCAEVLADLSEATNAILAQVANVSSVTVQFMPEEQSGKQVVGHRVLVEGAERDDGLSGGQLAALELAVDLAVVDVVVGRSRVVPKWMVLDEPFGGMGVPDREAFLEMLTERAHRNEVLYLVVDQHSREFSELFQQQGIGVEMSEGKSRIVSAEERGAW